MITTIERDDLFPLCPHCKKEITTVWFRQLKPDLGKRCVYFCPQCRACLGISHRKGLIMGM
jgi:hypothetical protein